MDNAVTDAIFVQAAWMAIFPAMIIGLSIGSLVFLSIEWRYFTRGSLVSFVVRDLLWMMIAIRRLLILDQSDVVIILLEFFICMFFFYATLESYRVSRRRNVLQAPRRLREVELEKLKSWEN